MEKEGIDVRIFLASNLANLGCGWVITNQLRHLSGKYPANLDIYKVALTIAQLIPTCLRNLPGLNCHHFMANRVNFCIIVLDLREIEELTPNEEAAGNMERIIEPMVMMGFATSRLKKLKLLS